MLGYVYKIELWQQAKRPFIWTAAFLMLLQGIYYMHHSGQFYANDETYANAPAIFYTIFAGIGYIGFILTALIAGNVLTKDLQSRFSGILFTTSISENAYYWGRYLSGFTVLLALNGFYLIGALLYSCLPVPNLGPVSFSLITGSVLYVLVPNTFILYSGCFAAAALSRNGKSAYLVSMSCMLVMIFSVSMHEVNRIASVMDPTSFGVLLDDLEHMSPAEKNAYHPSFFGVLTLNRFCWMVLAGLFLAWSRYRFSFKTFSLGMKESPKSLKRTIVSDMLEKSHPPKSLSTPEQSYSIWQNWKRAAILALVEFKTVVKPVGFRIFLAVLLVIYVCYIALWQQQYYSEAPTLPLTVEITNTTIGLAFYFQLFIIINTVELIFRDRTSGFGKISDALPLPSWTTALSKCLAMVAVGFLLCLFLIVLGVAVQAAKGYFHFELEVYYHEIIVRWMPKYISYILLCFAVAGLTNKHYATQAIVVLVLVVTVVLHELGVLEQHRFAFTFAPGALKYSDINGYSFYGQANIWYSLYWISFSLSLAFLALVAWPRGLESPLWKRIRIRGNTSKAFASVSFACFVLFLLLGKHIYHSVNVLNQFATKETERHESAEYEKTFGQYRHAPTPTIQHLNLDMDIYPEKRQLSYHAELEMVNDNKVPLETLQLDLMDFLYLKDVHIASNSMTLQDTVYDRHRIYKLEKPITAGQKFRLYVTAQLSYSGFTNDEPHADLTFNGSVIPSSVIPYFGYNADREIKETKYRKAYSLNPTVGGLPNENDAVAASQLFASNQAQHFTFDFRIKTAEDQTIIAPGILKSRYKDGERNAFHFVSENGIPYDFRILSERCGMKEKLVVVNCDTVTLKAYYHPRHDYNATAILQSAAGALDYLSKHLGPYPYKSLIIAEKPRYDQDLLAFGNVALMPENHGWIAGTRNKKDLDYIHYITTKLIAEQYFQRGSFCRVKGYPFLTKSIPGYLAMANIKELYGNDKLQKFLSSSHEKYLAGRSKAPRPEPKDLYCNADEDYIYEHKAIEDLYAWGEHIGISNALNKISDFYQWALKSSVKINTSDWLRSTGYREF